jgi:hypothetical protein
MILDLGMNAIGAEGAQYLANLLQKNRVNERFYRFISYLFQK